MIKKTNYGLKIICLNRKASFNYFFEDFSEYLINLEKSQEGHMNVNYNFLTKLYSELTADQKIKFNKSLQISGTVISKAV